jgi:cyclase
VPRAALLALILGVSSPASVPPPASPPFDYERVDIAPGVYGFFEKRLDPVVSGNIVAVVGTKSVLVFDTGHHPGITRRVIENLRKLTDLPVKYAVDSHWHDDHWVGNAAFAEAFPGIEIIATPFTARLIESRRDSLTGDPCRRDNLGDTPRLQGLLESGQGPDGSPLTDQLRQRIVRVLEVMQRSSAECDSLVWLGPNRTVDRTLRLDLGGRTVELSFLGRANTGGDLVAWLPESKILLTGDIVVWPFPFATQSYPTEWAAVLRRILAMGAAAFVPGHGPVLHDGRYLADLAELFESISRQGKTVYAPGMAVEQFKPKIDLTSFRERFSHGDDFIARNFDAMMSSALDRMYQELTGHLLPEGG